jgi:hypothetical protein
MLIYNPAFDLHHSVFRFLQILTAAPERRYEVERLRILDFFLLFPEQIENIRFPRELRGKKSLFRQNYNPYRSIENPRRLFSDITPFQLVALQSLAAHNLIAPDAFQDGIVQRTTQPLPDRLATSVANRVKLTPALIDLVSGDLARLPLHGAGGLKDRANLQDTRYDAA